MEPDGRAATTSARRGSRRSRRCGPAATTRIRSASTGRTRSAEVREHWDDRSRPATTTDDVVRVAGRVVLLRGAGQARVRTLRDGTGELQLFVSKGELGDDAFAAFATRSTAATGSASRAR